VALIYRNNSFDASDIKQIFEVTGQTADHHGGKKNSNIGEEIAIHLKLLYLKSHSLS